MDGEKEGGRRIVMKMRKEEEGKIGYTRGSLEERGSRERGEEGKKKR
jgi:hypothetical protein